MQTSSKLEYNLRIGDELGCNIDKIPSHCRYFQEQQAVGTEPLKDQLNW